MIFWIFVIIIAVSGFLCFYDVDVVFDIICVCSILIAGLMLFFIILSNTGSEGEKARLQQTYEFLVYQLNDDSYDNDKELFAEIQNYNESIAYYKEVQDDFWIGIFYPNIYDEFELIELGS